ncbi:MAG: hypothetical protein IJR90_04615 [Clostridia bacterium]|nr:hypothetical protein [Clostridia bacterium]
MKVNKIRSRLLAAIVLFAAAVTVSSCSGAKKDMLAYQRYPLFAECTLTYGGADPYPAGEHFSVEISSPGSGRLIFTDGELSGGTLNVTPEGVGFSDGGGFEVPLTAEKDAPARAVVAALSIGYEDLIAEIPEKDGEPGKIKADCAGGRAVVTVENGVPRLVEFDGPSGSFAVSVDRFANAAEG